jgi:hypothetical protein
MSENEYNYPMVYLYEEGILGSLMSYGAYTSNIRYELDGVTYNVAMLNEDFEIIQGLDLGIEDYE